MSTPAWRWVVAATYHLPLPLPTITNSNGQTTRVVILFDEHHVKLWDMTKEVLGAMIGAEAMEAGTRAKLESFQAGHGTILFFEDDEIIRGQQEAFKLYAHNFPVWGSQTNGSKCHYRVLTPRKDYHLHTLPLAVVQLICWTALEKEGYGATLQHYNEVIAQRVQSDFNVPVTWNLLAQMPFGKPTGAPAPKTFKPLEDRVKVFA